MDKHITCAGVIPVFFREGDFVLFLVRHRSGDYWGFPKGGAVETESLRQTAIRELAEETDLKVTEWLETSALEESYSFVREGMTVHKTVHYFVGKVLQSVYVIQEQEILEGRWVSPAQAQELITFDGLKQLSGKASQLISEGTFGKI